uniref:Autophagy-related protein 9 n=1 Tax=Esteya vermicola TaxID=522482 RepID=A0A286JQS0_9PEZI|nr:autophagy protein Apg9 [Esteya vermicola]
MESNMFTPFTPLRQSTNTSSKEDIGKCRRDFERGLDEEHNVVFAMGRGNLNQQAHTFDLEHAKGLDNNDSQASLNHLTASPSMGNKENEDEGKPADITVGDVEAAKLTTYSDKHNGEQFQRNTQKSRWETFGAIADDDGDMDDVPGSPLVELHETEQAPLPPMLKASPLRHNILQNGKPLTPRGRPTSRRTRAQHEARQKQQHPQNNSMRADIFQRNGRDSRAALETKPLGRALLSYFHAVKGGQRAGEPQQVAMWRWVNVTNLDIFIRDVYDYHRACGLRCILVKSGCYILCKCILVTTLFSFLLFSMLLLSSSHCLLRVVGRNVAFVAVFLTFMAQCIDYSKIRGSSTMSQIIVPQCTRNLSWVWNLGLWLFTFYFIWKTMQFFFFDLSRLLSLRDFFVYLLQIPEHDMQTVSWQDVVAKIMALRDQNPRTASNMTQRQREWIGSQSKERLDAHDIANRLMRRENYLIALFNKDILNLSIPLPFLQNTQLLTRTLEWTLWFAVLDFVFDDRGQVNQEFLKANRRGQLSQKLKSRFLFAGFMNLLLAPFVACYLVVIYVLTYYNEYQKNPSALSARAYTPIAEWKFREFNELDHLFEERLNMSCPFATRYLDQFPKRKTEQVAKTVAFIARSVMTVLAIASMVDPELSLGFEITHDRTVLFYVGIFATIWATARGMISEENSVFDPEYALRNVIEYTHYEPDHWKGRLHSHNVKMEFSQLYQNKIRIFLEEILSILITPLVLFTSLPKSSDQIVDFFREFTVHVDGLGYVCSFAVFDFNKDVYGNNNGLKRQQWRRQQQQPNNNQFSLDVSLDAREDARNDYYSTKHGKMAASYYGFLDNYVINPKTGIPGHHPSTIKHHYSQFHPPPTFPGLNSPTLAAEMQNSRIRFRGSGSSGISGAVAGLRPPRGGHLSVAQASPMASILLDSHNQPSASAFAGRSAHRPWAMRGGDVIAESAIECDVCDVHCTSNDENEQRQHQRTSEECLDDAALDESTWQTAPVMVPSRENSSLTDEPDVGVLGLMYQFQQAHMNHKPGGGR